MALVGHPDQGDQGRGPVRRGCAPISHGMSLSGGQANDRDEEWRGVARWSTD